MKKGIRHVLQASPGVGSLVEYYNAGGEREGERESGHEAHGQGHGDPSPNQLKRCTRSSSSFTSSPTCISAEGWKRLCSGRTQVVVVDSFLKSHCKSTSPHSALSAFTRMLMLGGSDKGRNSPFELTAQGPEIRNDQIAWLPTSASASPEAEAGTEEDGGAEEEAEADQDAQLQLQLRSIVSRLGSISAEVSQGDHCRTAIPSQIQARRCSI